METPKQYAIRYSVIKDGKFLTMKNGQMIFTDNENLRYLFSKEEAESYAKHYLAQTKPEIK